MSSVFGLNASPQTAMRRPEILPSNRARIFRASTRFCPAFTCSTARRTGSAPPACSAVRIRAWTSEQAGGALPDRKSTRLNSSHQIISYAVFCLKKKIIEINEKLRAQINMIAHLPLSIPYHDVQWRPRELTPMPPAPLNERMPRDAQTCVPVHAH